MSRRSSHMGGKEILDCARNCAKWSRHYMSSGEFQSLICWTLIINVYYACRRWIILSFFSKFWAHRIMRVCSTRNPIHHVSTSRRIMDQMAVPFSTREINLSWSIAALVYWKFGVSKVIRYEMLLTLNVNDQRSSKKQSKGSSAVKNYHLFKHISCEILVVYDLKYLLFVCVY